MNEIPIYDGKTVISRILTGENLSGVADVLAAQAESSSEHLQLFMVCDSNVRHIQEIVSDSIHGDVELCGSYFIEATEAGKIMETVLKIDGWLLSKGADRDAIVLAVGGGITTDLAGFAASIYKRGIRFSFIPTTLLSQVDAAIGGKTGVNYNSYKNIIGTICQPQFTYICPEAIETLPSRDFLSGAAELLKTFIIEDNGHYGEAVRFLEGLNGAHDRKAFLEERRAELKRLVSAAAAVKAGVVSRDQYEKGERKKLNLGHTFAHAIEKNAGKNMKDITHGEAVSMGIIMAARLSEQKGIAAEGFTASLESDFRSAGLETECPFAVATMEEAMQKDKKAENGGVKYVLIRRIGEVIIEKMTASEAVSILNANDLYSNTEQGTSGN